MNKTTILIVEDEAIIAADLAAKLLRLGYGVAGTAAGGEEAVRLAGQLRPHLVLMDIRLAGAMDGIATAEAIRGEHDVPVIYLTAHSDQTTLTRAKVSGPFGYILKPFEERELATHIELGLYKHQADRQLQLQADELQARAAELAAINEDLREREDLLLLRTQELEEARREAENERNRLEAVMEALPVGMAIVDARGGSVRFNKAYDQLWRGPRPTPSSVGEYAEYKAWWVDTGQAVAPEQWASALAVLKGETVVGQLMKIGRFDGSLGFVINSAAPIRDAAGNIVGSAVAIQDITDLHQAEEALRESEERFRLFMDHNPAIAWMKDEQGRYVYLNRTFEKRFGVRSADCCGKTDFDLWSPEIAAEFRKNDLAVLAAGEPMAVIEETVNPDGSRRFWLNSKFPFRDAAGKSYVAGMGLDITERKRAEEALRESEGRYRALVETAPDAIVVHRDGRLLHANSAALLLSGAESFEQLARYTVLYFFRPQDHKQVEEWIRMAMAGNMQPVREAVLVRLDGREVSVELHTVPVDFHGTRAILTIIHDVTVRRKREADILAKEAELQLIADATPVLLARLSRDLKYVFVNRAYLEMFGRSREEIIGKPIVEILGREAFETIRPNVERVLQGERVVYETRIPYQGIGTRFMRVMYEPERNGQGDIVGWIASVLDITEPKRVEEALRERTAEVEASNRELEAYAYSISHDLRTPLRAIHSYSDILLADYADVLDATGKDHLQRVCAATERMSTLMEAMLNLSRLVRSEPSREEVNLTSLARDAADELRRAEPERRVEFVIAENITVLADAAMIRAVLDHLLRNAWKFTAKHDRARIEFGAAGSGSETIYYVRDDGAGFKMEHAEKLFKAFQLLHRPGEYPGTGIGLATVQRIIHRHGGRIWAEGAVEKGATFYFTLG
ncbi:MAG: PAS domain S-box protein [Thermodesulfobacteriota bacterium]